MPAWPRFVPALVAASLLGSPGAGQEKPAPADKKPEAGPARPGVSRPVAPTTR